MEPTSEVDIKAAFEREVMSWNDVTAQTTFGRPSYLVAENLFAVISEQGVSLTSLTDADRRALAQRYPVRPFVANGRVIDSWATIAVTRETLEELFPAIQRSYERARAA